MVFRFRENEIENPAIVDAFKELSSVIRELEAEIRSTKRDPNYLLEGQSTERAVIRSVRFRITPGATPNTNIDISNQNTQGYGYNPPTLSNANDLAKSGTKGSYSLDSSGDTITVNTVEDVVGILSGSINIHDLNNSSVTEMYTAFPQIVSDKLVLKIVKRGSIAPVDWTTIIDADDRLDYQVVFLTSS
ncbi:hypothetical protein LCGC14_2734220 [marine sediment metagenome]|uniref:Uncharacterized protein n=1 Tax=marine sediment metagenome TaxID=412755 RepID=A0A0F9BY09_9ZZZZ